MSRSSIRSSRSDVFRDENPLGTQLIVDHFNEQTFSLERLPVTIVGVVANVRSASLAAEGRETIYVPYVFHSFLPLTFVVRTDGRRRHLMPQIRSEVAAMDRDVPIAEPTTLESYVTNAMAQTQVPAGAHHARSPVLALVLASLGLYGVISYSAPPADAGDRRACRAWREQPGRRSAHPRAGDGCGGDRHRARTRRASPRPVS